MDSTSLDRLAVIFATRASRRASLGLFAAVGLAIAGSTVEPATAKRRKKGHKKGKKGATGGGNERCLLLADPCVKGNGPRCCAGLTCDRTSDQGTAGSVCCQPEGTACTTFEGCCSRNCDSLVGGGTCAPCRGRSCSAQRPCCDGLECRNGYCGGCRDRATSCNAGDDCCYSDCTSGACLSAQGGACARDVDCRSCYLGHVCEGACVNGTCAF
jgi:hypothetical protein